MAGGTEDGVLTRRELEQKITAKAWADETFRKAFLADPKAVFEQRLRTKLPAGLSVKAFAEDENHLHFVIPAKPTNAELSEADLDKVAGGFDVVFGATAVVVVSAVVSAVTSVRVVKNEPW